MAMPASEIERMIKEAFPDADVQFWVPYDDPTRLDPTIQGGVWLTLVSDLAQAYFELLELDLELAIAKRTTESFAESLRIFTLRLQGGTASDLEAARAAGRFEGSAVDHQDGYIHFSTAVQAQETARRYFSGLAGLVVLHRLAVARVIPSGEKARETTRS